MASQSEGDGLESDLTTAQIRGDGDLRAGHRPTRLPDSDPILMRRTESPNIRVASTVGGACQMSTGTGTSRPQPADTRNEKLSTRENDLGATEQGHCPPGGLIGNHCVPDVGLPAAVSGRAQTHHTLANPGG